MVKYVYFSIAPLYSSDIQVLFNTPRLTPIASDDDDTQACAACTSPFTLPFLQHLRLLKRSDWAEFYINYKALKQVIAGQFPFDKGM